MTDAPDASQLPNPDVSQRHRAGLSLVWLVPLVAALAGLALVVRTYLETGPTVVITFETAEGLEAGKTEVKYKDVVVGKAKKILLSKDHAQIDVTVELSKNAGNIAVDDTRFWVERPRVGIGGVSGIGTLLSGAYIGIDIGASETARTHFKGLEKPPGITRDEKGRRFVLHTGDAGSLAVGAPVYYRKLPVGRVVSSDLDADGRSVTVEVFVDAPNDRYVTDKTRFWNASGVDVALGASGFHLNTQSLATVIAGGIAFQETGDDEVSGTPAADQAEFALYADQATALALPDGPDLPIRMRFRQSTRGLSIGAPIDFEGITLGSVKSILLDYDAKQKDFYTDVVADLYPQRMGPAYQTLKHLEVTQDISREEIFKRLITRGLRAQLRAGNVITGQLYVALVFVPGAKAVPLDSFNGEQEIPTAPGSLQELQTQVQNIARKLDAVPFDQIGLNLRDTLKSANSLLKQLDKDLAPEAKDTLSQARKTLKSLDESMAAPDSPLQLDARKTLEQLDRAASSFRTLSDYLEQHPESLIRGKSPDPEPGNSSGRNPDAP